MKKIISGITAVTIFTSLITASASSAELNEKLPYQDTSLSFEERAADLVSRMTLEEKVAQTGRTAPAIARLGVHSYNYWREGIHGVARQGQATSFPSSLAMSNTWDTALMKKAMEITSTEARAKNNRYDLSYWNPTINMARDPRWGRNEESYGEDPFLTAALGSAAVDGMQGDDEKYIKIISTLKHFAANNCEGERQTGTSVMSERTLREYYTKAFQDITEKSNPMSVMSSYNATTVTRNGEVLTDYIASSANKYLLTDLLRRTWGFGGYVVGDCGAWENLYGRLPLRKKLFPEIPVDDISAAMAVSAAYNAGSNLDCGARAQTSGYDAVAEGYTDEATLDRAVYELFLARMKTGEFDDGAKYQDIKASVIENDGHVAVAQQAAEESWVLLENRNETLPLKKTDNIAVVGNLADELTLGDYSGEPTKNSKPFEGIESEIKSVNPNAEVTLIGRVSDSTPLFDLKSITLVLNDGKTRTVNLSAAENVRGMTASGSGFTDVTKSGTAVIRNIDFSNVKTVRAEATLKPGTPAASINIGYSNATQTVAVVGMSNGVAEGEYTGATGGYNGTADMYITVSANASFSVENYKSALDSADYIIAYGGTTVADSSESNDRKSIDLPSHQSHVQQLCDAYPDKTIVALSTVGQIDAAPFKDKCAALLWTSYNGQKQGTALGRVLTGAVNPSGKLSTTWYTKADLDKMPIGSPREKIDGIDYNFTNYEIAQSDNYPGRTYQYYGGNAVYPFGYGKSYTSFEYSDINIEGSEPVQETSMSYENGKVSITADRSSALLVRASYTNGALAGAKLTPMTLTNGSAVVETDAAAGDKLMLWSSVNDMEPLCGSIEAVNGSTSAGKTAVLNGAGFGANDTITITADVTNTGSVAGAEVAQLYVSVPGADGKNLPLKQLKGFERVELAAGETKTVKFNLNIADVSFFDEAAQKNYVVQGEYTAAIGANSKDAALTVKFPVSGTIAEKVKNVRAVPTGIKLYAAQKPNGEIAPANSISAQASVALENDSVIDAADFGGVEYVSSNPAVAKVDSNGIVTSGGTAGTALITVKANGAEDSFAVVTQMIEAASDAAKAQSLAELDKLYNAHPSDAYTAENYALLTEIYNTTKAAIEAELREEKLAEIVKDASEKLAAVERIVLEDKYVITSTDLSFGIVSSDTVKLEVKDGANTVDTSAISWVVEKLDASQRTAPEIAKDGTLTVYENGAFRVTAYDYANRAKGSTVIYANIPIEGERADDGDGANLADEKGGASGGLCAGSTGKAWMRFDGVKLSRLTEVTLRVSKSSGESDLEISLNNGKNFKGNPLNSGSERIVASKTMQATGSWSSWEDVTLKLDRNEISKLNLDKNGCGTLYIRTNGANLDKISLSYIESDMDVVNTAGGKVKVTVPFASGVIVESRYTDGELSGTDTRDVTEAGAYVFEGFSDGDKAVYSLVDNAESMTELTAQVENTYSAPVLKTLTIYDFADPAFNSFFETSEGLKLTSGTGMNGIGGWGTQERAKTVEYKGKTYTFNRGLKGGSGNREKVNVYFVPDCDGLVTALLDTNTERKLIIEQDGKTVEGYGTGTDTLAKIQMNVKAGSTVYIYGGGSNKQFYGVIFDADSDYTEPTPTPTPEPTATPEPMPPIAYEQTVEFEDFAAKWDSGSNEKAETGASSGYVIENTRNEDIFYFGERDMHALEGIDLVAGVRDSAGVVTAEVFAVDVTGIDTATAAKADIMKRLNAENRIGIASALVSNPSKWNDFQSNIMRVSTDKEGSLGIFVKLTTTGKYCGNLDYIKLMYSE